MSPTKNAGSEKGSDPTGLLYRENIDYNGNICAPVAANYSPTLKKDQCSDGMAMPEVKFFLVVGIKDNDCSLCWWCIPRQPNF